MQQEDKEFKRAKTYRLRHAIDEKAPLFEDIVPYDAKLQKQHLSKDDMFSVESSESGTNSEHEEDDALDTTGIEYIKEQKLRQS